MQIFKYNITLGATALGHGICYNRVTNRPVEADRDMHYQATDVATCQVFVHIGNPRPRIHNWKKKKPSCSVGQKANTSNVKCTVCGVSHFMGHFTFNN